MDSTIKKSDDLVTDLYKFIKEKKTEIIEGIYELSDYITIVFKHYKTFDNQHPF